MMRVITSCIRTSNAKTISTQNAVRPLSVPEAHYLCTSGGARYWGAGPGFREGDKLHAVVMTDRLLPPSRKLSVAERFERLLYLADDRCITDVFSEGRKVL